MAVSIETEGVFGYDKASQRAGIRSMDSNRKFQVMLSEPKSSEASALIEVDEIPNHQANKPFFTLTSTQHCKRKDSSQ